MGDPKGFLTTPRELPVRRPVDLRLRDWREVYEDFPRTDLEAQAGRCMNCGIPFCHQGCPLGNLIPEWNDLVYRHDWREATERLHATNNFPEFTGTLCPAPCEAACVLAINSDAVTIKQVEIEIIDRAWDEGWVPPQKAETRTGKKVAVVGSGPSGLAAAQQLTRVGHDVVVFERADRIGGLLRYGIPEFKMEKARLDRRLAQMRDEGTIFKASVDVGTDVTAEQLRARVRRGRARGRGHRVARPARARPGSQGRLPGDGVPAVGQPRAAGRHRRAADLRRGQARRDHRRRRHRRRLPRHVAPAGRRVGHPAGDHADAAGEAHRGHALADLPDGLPRLVGARGGRRAAVLGQHHRVRRRRARQAGRHQDRRGRRATPRAGSCRSRAPSEELPAQLVLLAMGFVGPEKGKLLSDLGVELDQRGNVARDQSFMTSVEGVFSAGDMGRGQSLIVWAIAEGRSAAAGVDAYLTGRTVLPRPINPTDRPLL